MNYSAGSQCAWRFWFAPASVRDVLALFYDTADVPGIELLEKHLDSVPSYTRHRSATWEDLRSRFAECAPECLLVIPIRHAQTLDLSRLPSVPIVVIGTSAADGQQHVLTVSDVGGLVDELRSRNRALPTARVSWKRVTHLQRAQRKIFWMLALQRACLADGWVMIDALCGRVPALAGSKEGDTFDISLGAVNHHTSAIRSAGIAKPERRDTRIRLASAPRRDYTDERYDLEPLVKAAINWADWKPAHSPLPPVVYQSDLVNDYLIVGDDGPELSTDADFAVTLTEADPRLVPTTDGVHSYALQLDIGGRLAIHDNGGKHFLKDYFIKSGSNKRVAAKKSSEIHSWMLRSITNPSKDGLECRPALADRPLLPFRWASGGTLPLVRHMGRWWALLFFRDITPVGWNIANGASEGRSEHLNPLQLVQRETLEEIVVVGPGQQTHFLHLGNDPVLQQSRAKLASRLLTAHHKLRRKDGLVLHPPGPDNLIAVGPIMGPGSVELSDGDWHGRIDHVFVTIDPLDCGIEIVQLVHFTLPDEGWTVLDGEVKGGPEPALLKRPVGLLSLDHLRGVWEEQQSLGAEAEDGSKTLPSLPAEALMLLAPPDSPKMELESQQNRLCPVTWKVLEQAFASGRIDHLRQPT